MHASPWLLLSEFFFPLKKGSKQLINMYNLNMNLCQYRCTVIAKEQKKKPTILCFKNNVSEYFINAICRIFHIIYIVQMLKGNPLT